MEGERNGGKGLATFVQNEFVTLSSSTLPMIYFIPATQIVLNVPQIFSCSVLFNHLFPENTHRCTVLPCLRVYCSFLLWPFPLLTFKCHEARQALVTYIAMFQVPKCCSVGGRCSEYLLSKWMQWKDSWLISWNVILFEKLPLWQTEVLIPALTPSKTSSSEVGLIKVRK